MDLEIVMGDGQVSRKQAAILWLIHSRSNQDGWIRRKEIEDRLSTWFEVSNSSISNMLRELTRSPSELVLQIENPESGREKLVRLTPAGESFVKGMIEQATTYLEQHLDHLTAEEVAWGLDFLKAAFQPRAAISVEPRIPLAPPPDFGGGARQDSVKPITTNKPPRNKSNGTA